MPTLLQRGFAEDVEAHSTSPRMGQGPCSFPNCTGGGGFRPCEGFTGTAEDCLNCGHDYSYHS